MCAAAAHITDALLPDVPVRQWVLSVPFELRLLLARNAAALSAVGRIFVREISRWQCEQARASLQHEQGSPDAVEVRGGAICFPQRFGGSLNLNVHYHVVVPDASRSVCKGALTDERSQVALDAPATSEVAPTSNAAPTPPAPASDTRVDWATLLRRVHDIDALACPCGGRLRVIALITEPEVASAILTALHLTSSPPPIARARAPDHYDAAPD